MQIKMIEVRDSCTCIAAIAIRPWPSGPVEEIFLRYAGFGFSSDCILFGYLHASGTMAKWTYDPFDWPENPHTMRAAHHYVAQHFDELKNGAVVDIEYIMGRTRAVKQAEIV